MKIFKRLTNGLYGAFIIALCTINQVEARNVHRPIDLYMPEIQASWVGDKNTYCLKNYHLEEYALFKLFDKEYFEKHMLPTTKISYRYEPHMEVQANTLNLLIENLITQVKQHKRKLNDFIILQDKDFNYQKCRGLLVLKFKEYPFVVKLFMETPESFISPFDKGLEPIFFFFMAGGINRHESGYTRIKNLELIQAKLQESDQWKDKVSLPRKWYWLSQNTHWIELVGHNINGKKECKTQIPGTYCIIADYMQAERSFSLMNAHDKKTAMDLCNFLNLWIDPHITNFMIEKGTKKIVIIDTEHFPSFVGLKEKVAFNSYSEWYFYLAGKCLKNEFLLTKKERRNPKQISPLMAIA